MHSEDAWKSWSRTVGRTSTPAWPSVDIVVIGGSTGGLPALVDVLTPLPPDLPAAIFVVLHIAPESGGMLSGSASDGAAGLREIKGVGGLTIAQDPETARHDGMPRAAIATGVVDLILPPEAIGEELSRLGSHPFLAAASARESELSITDRQLERLFSLLRASSRVDFTHYKLPTIKRRLQRRMALHKVTEVERYLKLLEAEPGEVRSLYRDILIHVTRFFRDPNSFVALNTVVFAGLAGGSGTRKPMRIWVPGCATGEEAYSIAIALLEHLGEDASGVPMQVFATDVKEEAIERARGSLPGKHQRRCLAGSPATVFHACRWTLPDQQGRPRFVRVRASGADAGSAVFQTRSDCLSQRPDLPGAAAAAQADERVPLRAQAQRIPDARFNRIDWRQRRILYGSGQTSQDEELQSANEEILSSNEELQSTNEELDTAKEELQSTNEELSTVNEELNSRNEELVNVNSDLVNLLGAVPAAIVIVSQRFTDPAIHAAGGAHAEPDSNRHRSADRRHQFRNSRAGPRRPGP